MRYLFLFVVLARFNDADAQTGREFVYQVLSKHNITDQRQAELAVGELKKYLTTHPRDPYSPYCNYSLADAIYRHYPANPLASEYYKAALRTPAGDSVENVNARNESAKRLAAICITNTDYNSALHFLDTAVTSLHVAYECGNSRAENQLELSTLYARCYSGMGDHTRAIDSLGRYVFGSSFARTDDMVATFYSVLLKLYDSKTIRKEFSKLSERIQLKKEKGFVRPTVTLFQKVFPLPDYFFFDNEKTDKMIIDESLKLIRQSAIYKRVFEKSE